MLDKPEDNNKGKFGLWKCGNVVFGFLVGGDRQERRNGTKIDPRISIDPELVWYQSAFASVARLIIVSRSCFEIGSVCVCVCVCMCVCMW